MHIKEKAADRRNRPAVQDHVTFSHDLRWCGYLIRFSRRDQEATSVERSSQR
jgi:hypothetical protein